MNVHDSEKMLGILSGNGYTLAEAPDNADLIIFNTCAIRAKAEQKFYSQLGRMKLLKKKRSDLKIAVAGCVAQDEKSRLFKKAPFIDIVLGPQNIHRIDEMISSRAGTALVENNNEIAFQEFGTKRQNKIKAWVSIMYGCNNFCSYCIVPYTRGREVSRPSSSILAEIKTLSDQGYKEITLLGQNVNSYRSDVDFAELLTKIDSIGIDRVRFVTSHPRDLSPELIDVIAGLPSICEHIHLPIQSGSDRILHLMNRRYSYADYIERIRILRDKIPGISISADVIAGFPDETDDDFNATIDAIKHIEFDSLFAFKFSPRKDTKAYLMENQIPENIKAERLNLILKTQDDITYRKNKLLEGTIQEILIEGPSDTDPNMLMGRTRTNKIVTILKTTEQEGSIARVKIERARHHSLYGTNIEVTVATN